MEWPPVTRPRSKRLAHFFQWVPERRRRPPGRPDENVIRMSHRFSAKSRSRRVTKNRRWLLALVPLMLACSDADDRGHVSTAGNQGDRLQICPEDLEDDLRKTLGLGGVNQISLDALVHLAEERGFSRYVDHYGSSPPNHCADLRDLDTSTKVLWIRAGLDETKLTSRKFVVLADASGTVTHIEGRYAYEPPPPWYLPGE